MKQFLRAHSRDHHQSLIIEGKTCKVREGNKKRREGGREGGREDTTNLQNQTKEGKKGGKRKKEGRIE